MDCDGDGRLDLYVVDMHSDMWIPYEFPVAEVEEKRKYKDFFGPMQMEPGRRRAAEQLFLVSTRTRYEAVLFGNALYRNRGDGTFEEISDRSGAETFWPWGIGAGDFDGDGFEDAFIPSGMGYPWEFWRNSLLMNDGDGTFTDRSREFGVEPPPGGPFLGPTLRGRRATRSSRCVAVADFDGDGGLDLVVNNFNDRPYLYFNRFPRKPWIGFRLEATRGPRDAVGALALVHAGGRVLVRQVHAAGGYLAQSSKTLHFGLGGAASVDRCEIRWPGGRVQVLEAPATNRVHVVVEPRD
jgi:hypothetical protein